MTTRGDIVTRSVRGGSTYGLLTGLQRVLPLVLLPLYAASLSSGEYGQIAIVMSVMAVAGVVLSLGMETAILRDAVQLRENSLQLRQFVNTMGLFATAFPLAGALLVWVAVAVGSLAFGLENVDYSLVLVALLGTALQTTLTVLVGALLRARERLRALSVIAAIQAGVTAAATVALVVILQLGVLGWFLGTLTGSGVALAVGIGSLDHKWTSVFATRYVRVAFAFGVPLLPHMLAHWVLGLSDRIVLAASVATAEVGAYSVAYQLAAGIGLVAIALHQGVMPHYADGAKSEVVRRGLERFATYQAHVTLVLGLAVALLGPVFVKLALPADYSGAGSLFPVLAVGFVLFGLYLIPVDSISLLLGQTRWLWVPTTVAAATNLALNVLLVPSFGATAAAANTAIAYGVLAIGVNIYRRRLSGPRLRYESRRIGGAVALVLFAGLVTLVLAPDAESPTGIGTRVVLVGCVLIVLAVAHLYWRREEHAADSYRSEAAGNEDSPRNLSAEAERADE